MSKIALALSAPVMAVTAVATTGGFSATATAQPVSQVHAFSTATTASILVSASPSARAGGSARQVVRHHRRHRRLSPKQIAWQMMHRFGWKALRQFRYLRWLWERESSWNVHASNPYSGAYGIPQAVPGAKMASAGADWQSSARTQIRWGMRYIRSIYGSPRRAWDHECAYGWY